MISLAVGMNANNRSSSLLLLHGSNEVYLLVFWDGMAEDHQINVVKRLSLVSVDVAFVKQFSGAFDNHLFRLSNPRWDLGFLQFQDRGAVEISPVCILRGIGKATPGRRERAHMKSSMLKNYRFRPK